MHFRSVKDAIAQPLHRFGFFLAGLPDGMSRAALAGLGAFGKAAYFMPGSHIRRTVGNFCRATGRSNPWPIYSGMINNVQAAAFHYSKLYRYGRSMLLTQTVLDPTVAAEYQRLGNGKTGVILLVPHCIGAVLSSAGLSTFCPTALLVREPRSPARCQLMVEYLQKLGPKFILSRNTPPTTVMRNIARSLRDREVVVGTTDVASRGDDTIETRAFGQPIHSPAWPARISARFGMPILPGFIHMEDGKFRLIADEGYLEPELQKSTQRWISSFERRFREYPSDWVFMLDKNWARVLAAAAAQVPRTTEAQRHREPSAA